MGTSSIAPKDGSLPTTAFELKKFGENVKDNACNSTRRFGNFEGMIKGCFFPIDPPPPPKSVDEAAYTPEATASFFSLLTFSWLTPLMALGFSRPLEAPDLWRLQDHRSSAVISDKILTSFAARRVKADEWNARLDKGEIRPGVVKRAWWIVTGKETKAKKWREAQKKKASLAMAMNDSVMAWFWWGGIFKLISDMSQVTSPLLVKALINFATASYDAHQLGQRAPSIGKGLGYAFGLLALQALGFVANHHYFYRTASTGVLLRGGLITSIYSLALRLTTRSRSKLPNGRLVNHISTDVSRIDFCCQNFHVCWTAPVTLIVCLVQLIINLGPSALAGFATFIALVPVQGMFIGGLIKNRVNAMVWTDKRVKALQELFGGMMVIKYFTWEVPMLKRVREYRRQEMGYVRTLLFIKSANSALMLATPALAAVVAFLVYSASGHTLNPANIFASLTLFTLLRMPLGFLPMSIGAITDASNAVKRLQEVFEAELVTETLITDLSLPNALEVKDASFSWDITAKDAAEIDKTPDIKDVKIQMGPGGGGPKSKDKGKGKGKDKGKDEDKDDGKASLSSPDPSADKQSVFTIDNISLTIPRGSLVAIVGPVGSGKTSLLQGLIGEMRRASEPESVKFGGSVAYCSQSAWIQNASIRENVCFGKDFEEERYWRAVRDACLGMDLEMLPHGDLTEVGEKGISLSGGQKQRLNIARAIYSDCDIMIFDDPLSALDAHVGESVFNNVLLNSSAGKTRILVTHALHFLSQADYIYTLEDGKISEHGTYEQLTSSPGGVFASLIDEFLSKDQGVAAKTDGGAGVVKGVSKDIEQTEDEKDTKKGTSVVQAPQMMQEEERNKGSVDWSVYGAYLKAGHGGFLGPFFLVALAMWQGTQVMSSYWLVYWQEMKWAEPQGFYMGIYAALGFGQALTGLFMGVMMSLIVYSASKRLHHNALNRVMHAPMSFFETTPLGRIMNRFSKDVDALDNVIADDLRMFINMAAGAVGAIILIAIIIPWFLIAVAVCAVLYALASAYYRASAVEIKRLDAILRSSLYSHFSESLSGLATIRAYGEFGRFHNENEKLVDIENRAYWMTVVNQRWLGIRLDCFGTLLTFAVAVLTVGTRFTISPAQTGVVLSYILQVQVSFGYLIRQLSQVENDMNSVERMVYYTEHIEQEAPHEIESVKPPASWPSAGEIEFKDVVMRYRPSLPPVLKGLSLSVRSGEKIGIVGRTGAGKSSVMVALFRIVEAMSGSMTIDGIDISKVGLADVRGALSIIPQEATLFSGTLRSNLDPFNVHDDAKLWDALKRSYLVDQIPGQRSSTEQDHKTGSSAPSGANPRFSLDSPIDAEGANLSIGQRSLVSLARALVKDSKILVLDEATASVDYETDRNIQKTIATEFGDRTILCIAHRLRTIISYDRICVLDAGKIAELDTPENLYQMENGVFRGMCERSGITLDDLRHATKERGVQGGSKQ